MGRPIVTVQGCAVSLCCVVWRHRAVLCGVTVHQGCVVSPCYMLGGVTVQGCAVSSCRDDTLDSRLHHNVSHSGILAHRWTAQSRCTNACTYWDVVYVKEFTLSYILMC